MANSTRKDNSRLFEDAPSQYLAFPQNEAITAVELLAFDVNKIRSHDTNFRLHSNGATNQTVQTIINYHREKSPKGEAGANTLCKMMQKAMRDRQTYYYIVMKKVKGVQQQVIEPWMSKLHKRFNTKDHYGPWDPNNLECTGYAPDLSRPEDLVRNLRFDSLAVGVKRYPSIIRGDGLNLTSCVQYAVAHPEENWMYPRDFTALIDRLGRRTIQPQHLDAAVFDRFKNGQMPNPPALLIPSSRAAAAQRAVAAPVAPAPIAPAQVVAQDAAQNAASTQAASIQAPFTHAFSIQAALTQPAAMYLPPVSYLPSLQPLPRQVVPTSAAHLPATPVPSSARGGSRQDRVRKPARTPATSQPTISKRSPARANVGSAAASQNRRVTLKNMADQGFLFSGDLADFDRGRRSESDRPFTATTGPNNLPPMGLYPAPSVFTQNSALGYGQSRPIEQFADPSVYAPVYTTHGWPPANPPSSFEHTAPFTVFPDLPSVSPLDWSGPCLTEVFPEAAAYDDLIPDDVAQRIFSGMNILPKTYLPPIARR